MRLNQYIALHTPLSRRAADREISRGAVMVNGKTAMLGANVESSDTVRIDGRTIQSNTEATTVIFHKPLGYVCSRRGQGTKTIYEVLPEKFHHLNSVGRLDKDSSGLLLLTNDGELANVLAHPRYQKIKIYTIKLNKPLTPLHQQMISDYGIQLEDGLSKLTLEKLNESTTEFQISMKEGRNRQIRRTFASLGYNVTKLHRIQFGDYKLGLIASGEVQLAVVPFK